MSSIETIAIDYGDQRYGRSCGNCNYLGRKIMSVECGLHCLPTSLSKCCGTWSGEQIKSVEEKQAELW